MADVAFVPQSNVLECRLQITTQKPDQTADVFAGDGILFVGHTRRARLSLGKPLLGFTYFAALQVANFYCDAF